MMSQRMFGIEHHVVEAVIVVDDATGVVVCGCFREPREHVFAGIGVLGERLLPAIAPAGDLPRDIAFALADVLQLGLRGIDLMQFDQAIDEAKAELAHAIASRPSSAGSSRRRMMPRRRSIT
jgi:hypothetical protein